MSEVAQEPTTALEVVNDGAYQPQSVIDLAVSRGATVDEIKALIDMKHAEEDREARREFGLHFAEMQAEFTSVKRSKEGYGYNYAPIEVLQKAYGPIIARHGFSYRWREEIVENHKRVTMTISGHGHAEETCFDVPPLESTERMNSVQAAGAMSTYGRRYTFIAGFGVVIEDEDDDAMTVTEARKYADYLNALDAETTIDDLYETVKKYRDQLRKERDDRGVEVVTQHYTKCKQALQE